MSDKIDDGNGVELTWHGGLLYLSQLDLNGIADTQTVRELLRRWEHLPRVGHLRGRYVIDNGLVVHFSLQALCALCGNALSVGRAHASDDPVFQTIFDWARNLILQHSAYHEYALPQRPWKPLVELKKRGGNIDA